MPKIARYDFQEAGRCIAFELPTAAAFHLMRGTEDVLRALYCVKVKQKAKRVDPLKWGPMLIHLNKLTRPLPKELMHELDWLREHFRNPTQHPEKMYDLDEAQGLLERSIDVVNRMMKVIG
jgi:hypothetical protein